MEKHHDGLCVFSIITKIIHRRSTKRWKRTEPLARGISKYISPWVVYISITFWGWIIYFHIEVLQNIFLPDFLVFWGSIDLSCRSRAGPHTSGSVDHQSQLDLCSECSQPGRQRVSVSISFNVSIGFYWSWHYAWVLGVFDYVVSAAIL